MDARKSDRIVLLHFIHGFELDHVGILGYARTQQLMYFENCFTKLGEKKIKPQYILGIEGDGANSILF